MAKSNKQKLERLYKLSIAFNDVAKAVKDIIENNKAPLNDHINTIKLALISSGHDKNKDPKSSRDMVFSLRNNKQLYKKLIGG